MIRDRDQVLRGFLDIEVRVESLSTDGLNAERTQVLGEDVRSDAVLLEEA